MNICPDVSNIARLAATAPGVGLKPQHYAEILATRPDLGFFEIHAENYMSAGGPERRWLQAIAEHYPLSVHGVGLSLGSAEPLDRERLARLARVVALYQPALVSEHLAWCDFSNRAFPDLLPLPYDEASCRGIADRVDAVQTALGRTILVENPATYLRYRDDCLAETQFLDELAEKSGCGLLLDVNNVHVCAINHGFSAQAYLDAFPFERVGEIHLAGFAQARDAHGAFLVDDHGSAVSDEVWALYAHVLRIAGPKPTLIEWDNGVPEWKLLHAEARKAARMIADAGALPPLPASGGRACVSGRGISLASEGAPAGCVADWFEGQSLFAAALADPALPPPDLFTPCDASARFAIYRNNSAVASINALKEQFPTVTKLVGDDAFQNLARAFVAKFPPRSPVLADYGAEFPGFVAEFLALHGVEAVPYLPDMARLDWARLQSLRSAEAPPCTPARLAELDAGRLAETQGRPPSLAGAGRFRLADRRDPRRGTRAGRGLARPDRPAARARMRS